MPSAFLLLSLVVLDTTAQKGVKAMAFFKPHISYLTCLT